MPVLLIAVVLAVVVLQLWVRHAIRRCEAFTCVTGVLISHVGLALWIRPLR